MTEERQKATVYAIHLQGNKSWTIRADELTIESDAQMLIFTLEGQIKAVVPLDQIWIVVAVVEAN